MSNVDDFLMGKSGVSCQFPKIGHSFEGIVDDFEMEQQRDYDDQDKLLWWDKGETKPKMHLVVTLRTNARGKFSKSGAPIDVEGDDGTRNLYVKGQMREALRRAVRRSGAKSLEVGARIRVTYVGDGKQDNPRFNPPKQFEFEYTVPSKASADEFLKEPEARSDDPFA